LNAGCPLLEAGTRISVRFLKEVLHPADPHDMNLSRRSTAPLGALLALSLVPSVAQAATTRTASDPCGYGPSSQVFLGSNDHKHYVLAPNGGFEATDPAWTLANDAAVVEGNDTLLLGAATDHQSLSLPAGSSATSPVTCIASGQPTFRFAARASGVDKHSRLGVEILYTGKKGAQRSAVVGKLRAGEEWAPTKKLAVRLGRVKTHGKLKWANVTFRFTPVGVGDWQVDDLYLDPRARR
jgi:hypothetical protein